MKNESIDPAFTANPVRGTEGAHSAKCGEQSKAKQSEGAGAKRVRKFFLKAARLRCAASPTRLLRWLTYSLPHFLASSLTYLLTYLPAATRKLGNSAQLAQVRRARTDYAADSTTARLSAALPPSPRAPPSPNSSRTARAAGRWLGEARVRCLGLAFCGAMPLLSDCIVYRVSCIARGLIAARRTSTDRLFG